MILCLFLCFDSSAIVAKFKGMRASIKAAQTQLEAQLIDTYNVIRGKVLGATIGHGCGAEFQERFRRNLTLFERIVLGDPPEVKRSPHVFIQSDYIFLRGNLDIHYAMNYILSPFCTGIDEVAVVTLLKQLTAFADGAGARGYVWIIKAIWDRLLCDDRHARDLRDAVLHYADKNVASYSLKTLAVDRPDNDQGILATLMKLLNVSMEANQNIKLATYNCVIRRLKEIPNDSISLEQLGLIRKIWNKSKLDANIKIRGEARLKWGELMLAVCHRFNLKELEAEVKMYYRTGL